MKTSVPVRTPAVTEQRPRPGQVLKLFAAAVFLALALPLIVLAGLLAWHQRRILTTWPVADAVVTRVDRSSTTNHGARQPATAYSVRFTFRYIVAGRAYQSSSQLGYTTVPSHLENWIQQMPVGSHTRLRYDPENPSQISLAADYTPLSFAIPLKLAKWAGVATLVSLALLFLGWRAGESPAGGEFQR